MEFTGKAGEYFKIWIVNVLLTILTLGIYSAWAKVRNKQYFYGNTFIDGSSFRYTASPVQILKARLIAVTVLSVYLLVSGMFPPLELLFFFAFLLMTPWIIVRALAFNARHSMYRNVPFAFHASVGEAAVAFLFWPMLLVPTLGLILPTVWYKQRRFIVANHAFGTTPFDFTASHGAFYRVFLIGGLLLLVGGGLAAMLDAGLTVMAPGVGAVAMGGLLLIMYVGMFAYFTAALGNLQVNGTGIAQTRFKSNYQTRDLAWLYLTNTLGIALSLGLLIPWAKVRLAAYRASHTWMETSDSLDGFIAAEQGRVSALGDQFGEVFDMDIGAL